MSKKSLTALKFWRMYRGLTAKATAAKMGISITCYSLVETGTMQAWPKFKRTAAAVLDVPEHLLFEETGGLKGVEFLEQAINL